MYFNRQMLNMFSAVLFEYMQHEFDYDFDRGDAMHEVRCLADRYDLTESNHKALREIVLNWSRWKLPGAL